MKKTTLLFLMCFGTLFSFAQTFNGSTGNITDNNCDATHDFPVTVSGVGVLGITNNFSNVAINITHTYDADLDIYLVAPDGTTIIELSTDNGGSGDNFVNTIITDNATTSITSGTAPFTGSYNPEGNLAALSGINADGTWILRVCDDAASDIGTVDAWSITFAPVIFDLPDWCNLQYPFTASLVAGSGNNVTVYGRVYEGGLTDSTSGQAPGIDAWVGYSTTNTNPNTWTNWIAATFNVEAGNNDEYMADFGSTLGTGTYYYATRFRLNGGAYVYGGSNDGFWDGITHLSGVLTVTGPPNDDCAGAIPVTCGSSTTGTTANSTNENMAVCGISGVTAQNTPGVWYKFTGDGSDVTVTTCSSNIASGDSRIAVFSGACGSMTCVGGNDDSGAAGCSANTLASTVSFSTAIGTDYYILVYAYLSTALNFELNVTCNSACTPANTNDECATALPLIIGTTTTTDNSCSSASLDTTYPTCGGLFNTYYDSWYSFDSASSTDLTVTMANPTGTTGFAVYSGTCGALTMITGSCSTTATSISLTGLSTDTTYYIRTFSTTSANRGAFDLTVSSSLGTNSFENGSFSYFPNPVKNILSLSYNQEISTVEIYNLLGQKVYWSKFKTSQAQVDMSQLSSGAYMVKVISNKQVKTIKVIKE